MAMNSPQDKITFFKWLIFCILAGGGLFLIGLIVWVQFPKKQMSASYAKSRQPHIVFIFADDLGWGDVSYHGSPEIPTPNIDAMGLAGITLHNYYTQWVCTPSRGSLLTGNYAIRLGLHHHPLVASAPAVIPLEFKTLPEHLKHLGYATHMIGKWHLGFKEKKYTPTFRGFDTFFGYYNGYIDYYDYTHFARLSSNSQCPIFGVDIHEGEGRKLQDVHTFRGQYATREFTSRSVELISKHDSSKPLFLFLSHLAVHTGNPFNPNTAPAETVRKFSHIKPINRRNFAGVVSELDDSIGAIFKALHQKDMLSNSIVIFASDNGGEFQVMGGVGSNYPLRGKKWTLWEGGCRVPAVLWSPLLQLDEQRVSRQLMHVTDWLPTLYSAAGGDVEDLGDIDGYDMWTALKKDLPSPRQEMLYNYDPLFSVSAYKDGDLKIINGSNPLTFDYWQNYPGTEHVNRPKSMYDYVFQNGSVVRDILQTSGHWMANLPNEWYQQNTVVCKQPTREAVKSCNPYLKPCLFNLTEDPCEHRNLADELPKELESLMSKILDYSEYISTQQDPLPDPRGDPLCHNFTFVPWLEPEYFNDCLPSGYCYENDDSTKKIPP